MTMDRRLTPARGDIAAERLRGLVEATRFVAGRPMTVGEPVAALRRRPQADASYETEALMGEVVDVYDETEGWAWGQLTGDGYVGWLPSAALRPEAPTATHKVAATRSFLYPAPSLKAPPAGHLSLGARVAVARVDGSYAETAAGWLFAGHLRPLDWVEPDFVAVAERFLHVPYLWGGKTSLGLDCSALVQVALAAAGIAVPRDSDMQEADVGSILPLTDAFDGLRRGDLVFWKGHVGIMQDGDRILHANGHHMAVASERLADAVARILKTSYGPVTAIRRP